MSSVSRSARSPAPVAAARPPRALALVREPRPEEIGAPIDWSAWRLAWEDDVGQSPEQDVISRTFESALEQWLDERGRAGSWVGRDAFFAWLEHEPLVRVSPDVYTLALPPPTPLPRMFETWRPGQTPPVFALEVVSDDWKKDYDTGPAKYALLGARELVIFDADALRGPTRPGRVPLQIFRREDDGAFVRTYAGPGPARAETLGAWLVTTASGDPSRLLRLSRDAAGEDLVPTAAERVSMERRRADEQARRADELERELAALRAGRTR